MGHEGLAAAIDRGDDLTGVTVTDKGLTSVMLNSGVGKFAYGLYGEATDGIEWELKVPAGTKALFRSDRMEPEMILAPGSSFRITGYEVIEPDKYTKHSRRVIYAEVEQ